MPQFDYKGAGVAYTREGKGKTVLFLHGWGADGNSFKPIAALLGGSYDLIRLDFPGFGQSDPPPGPWALDDYADMVEAFLNTLEIEKPILIGHSFGGRVIIKLAQRIAIEKIILAGSAGIKPKRKSGYYIKVYGYKGFKFLAKVPVLSWLLKEPFQAYTERYSSTDYKNASPLMKQVLSKVVNEDLTDLLSRIEVPTLLIWGDRDESTPIADAHLMASRIPDAGLVVFEGAGHFAFLEQPVRFAAIIKSFIGG